MNARVTLFAAVVGLALFAGCSTCKKAKKTENTENVLGSLGSKGITKSAETAKENLASEEV
jgi:outer membrane murein-binding lipoprotein Lpp